MALAKLDNGQMNKNPVPFSASWSRFALVCGLIAVLTALAAAPALARSAPRKVSGAQVSKSQRVSTVIAGLADPDRDGLTTFTEERRTKTSPRKFDTDGDGFGDGAEVRAGTNPRSSRSVPAGPPAPTAPGGEQPTQPSRPSQPSEPTPPAEPTEPTTPTPPADTTAPATTITSGPSGATTATDASLGFSSSESGSTFQCKLDSGSWASCTSPKSYSGLPVGAHTFEVKATDAAGNTDGSPASRSWTVQSAAPPADTTPPATTITSGPSGTTTATEGSLGFSSSESGSSFQCKLDSGSWATCTSPKSYSGLTVGAHTFEVKATDTAGNTDGSPASRSWTVQSAAPPADTTPPATTITSGPSGATTATDASLGFSSSESGSSFQCKLDSGSWASCTSAKSYSGLAAGSHTFEVKATDAAGNTDASPAARSWTVSNPPPVEEGGGGSSGGAACTQTLSAGANVSTAISNAAAGAVICLPTGSYSGINVTKANKSSMVTVRAAAGATPSVAYSMLNQATNLRFEGLKFTGGMEALGPASKIQLIDNEFVGPFGFHANGQAQSNHTEVTDVLIEGNYMHELDYTGTQGTANGYGVTASNGVSRFTIAYNTIKSPASDYVQSASPNDFTVDHNTFLGPSLLGSHQDHQDLWQIFGGGKNIRFTNNVARNTETQESLLFQEGAFSNVVVENNLFDHDSRGYTCQIYQSTGLIFRDNTIVGSHWGCLFRDLASSAAGSGYQVDHNIFVGTAEGSDISTEGRSAGWGTYDYNVSEDGSASGSHSMKNWTPSWVDTTNYLPKNLSITAGYRP